ncbi:MAG: VWA domain-containing protein [Bacteroidia bacterium]|nr:VWA domain-containing protein [Bacteroidia bacterium]
MPSISLTAAANGCWLDSLPRQEWYLYFEIQGADAPPSEQRVPLNLALVLDRSGSMQGEKIAYVRQAAAFVVDHLGAEDTFALVQYDSVIDVLSPAARVQDKAALKRQIQTIEARDSTNLSGGMLEGFSQAMSRKEPNRVNRVLLLTDGLANQGVTDPGQLRKLAQDKFRQEGIGVSTFGVGADFNEELLMGLAEYGGGNYYFIANPDEIPGIFQRELAGLLTVVAQQAVLTVSLGDTGLRCEQVYGYPGEISAHSVRVNFNDVFAGEKKAVLLKLVADAPLMQAALSFQAELTYVDALQGFASAAERRTLEMRRAASQQDYDQALDPLLAEQTVLFLAVAWYEQAQAHADRRDFKAANAVALQAKAYLEGYFSSHAPSKELSRLYNKLLQYEKLLEEMPAMDVQMFHSSSKAAKYAAYLRRSKRSYDDENDNT